MLGGVLLAVVGVLTPMAGLRFSGGTAAFARPLLVAGTAGSVLVAVGLAGLYARVLASRAGSRVPNVLAVAGLLMAALAVLAAAAVAAGALASGTLHPPTRFPVLAETATLLSRGQRWALPLAAMLLGFASLQPPRALRSWGLLPLLLGLLMSPPATNLARSLLPSVTDASGVFGRIVALGGVSVLAGLGWMLFGLLLLTRGSRENGR